MDLYLPRTVNGTGHMASMNATSTYVKDAKCAAEMARDKVTVENFEIVEWGEAVVGPGALAASYTSDTPSPRPLKLAGRGLGAAVARPVADAARALRGPRGGHRARCECDVSVPWRQARPSDVVLCQDVARAHRGPHRERRRGAGRAERDALGLLAVARARDRAVFWATGDGGVVVGCLDEIPGRQDSLGSVT